MNDTAVGGGGGGGGEKKKKKSKKCLQNSWAFKKKNLNGISSVRRLR